MVRYSNYLDRIYSHQYRQVLQRIMAEGVRVGTKMGEDALTTFGHQMRFNLENGFPIITERDLVSPGANGGPSQFEMAIAELCAFLNGARTLEEMKQFGCGWWAPWVTAEKCAKRGLEPGDLGPGSYGAAFHDFPTADGRTFNQVQHLVEQIVEMPELRTHILTPFIPQYLGRGKGKQQRVVVVPCHGLVHVMVNARTKQLSLHHFQRSADAPVGLVFNLIQYAALTLMLAQVTGYAAHELVFTTSDTHIYVGGPNDQVGDVNEMLATTPGKFPTVTLNSEVRDIFTFRPHHFSVSDYEPRLPRRRIKTPI
ncbi:MAG: thymidylate synthase [Candidatus Sungbacteria bacterium RIFCSPHIGHO2_02_FULL_49_12]|uniref:Thymidylate synthase n=1 Tax=Candidatus Sungbacteria bacterium RIFCSPHIGHO2_02_FULL_49_12 TaxID=1802271 RepID=A0A1G2KNW8_9BACT|nr:MAG: thymidylate synthase [Candidatus Sungbacteria bacterium RIFCSPHIGHO2_02_FULL_49_12]